MTIIPPKNLTEEEWMDMWRICKEMEIILHQSMPLNVRNASLEGRIDLIQRYIHQVVGEKIEEIRKYYE